MKQLIGKIIIAIGIILFILSGLFISAWSLFDLLTMLRTDNVTFLGVLWVTTLWLLRGSIAVTLMFVFLALGLYVKEGSVS